jgi:hypothetical protein
VAVKRDAMLPPVIYLIVLSFWPLRRVYLEDRKPTGSKCNLTKCIMGLTHVRGEFGASFTILRRKFRGGEARMTNDATCHKNR